MANKLQLFLVVDDKRFVQSTTNGGDFTLPTFVQSDQVPIELTLLQKNLTGGITAPYTVLTEVLNVRVGIVTPHPTSAQNHAIATLTFATNKFTGYLDLNTSQIVTLLNGNASASAVFEVEITGTNNTFTVQREITVKADGLKTGSPVSLSGTSIFYTAAETGSLFLRKNTGDTISGPTPIALNHPMTTGPVLGFTRDTDNKQWHFGTWTGAAWSDTNDTIARVGDVVLKTGGTFTGAPRYGTNPSHPDDLARKGYVDSTVFGGGTLTGPLFASRDPVANNEVATKAFVVANSGTTPIGVGLIRTGGSLLVDFGTTVTQVATGSHNHLTSQVIEGSNQWFTYDRVRATELTGLDTATTGGVSASVVSRK